MTNVRRRDFLRLSAGVATAGVAGGGLSLSLLGNAAQGANDVILLGINVELSAGWENYGGTFVNAVKLAMKEINEQGGLLGRKLDLVVEDNKIDPRTVVEKARKLIQQDNVDVHVGPIASSSRNAAAPLVTRAKKIMLYPIQYEGGVCDKYIFITGPVPFQQIDPTVPWLIENFGNRFYLFGSDYVWPHEMNKAVRARLEQLGGTVVGEEYAPFGTTDHSSTINRIKAAQPDVLFMELTGKDVVAFSKQFHQFGLKDQIRQVSLAHDNDLLKAIGPEAGEGIISINSYVPEIDTPENQRFVAAFKQEFGEDAFLTYITEPVYNIIHLYAQGIEQAGTLDTDALIKGVEDQRFNAPSGKIWMRPEDHHCSLSMYIAQWTKDERYEIVEAFHDIIPGETQCA
jgi:urea transport system substrate-binding protein